MTSILTFMSAAVQHLRTWQQANVFDINATQLVAVMFTAGSFLLAALFTARIIRLAYQISTSDFSIHVTTSAFHISI